ncbi:response regulator transcription factor [Salinarimonas soli]|uniref:Response regulator transcription factor n=1 Tax=Salinarimonas soli TaxID=1638099 RepID=A0A5B2VG11_9HYPH|nr:response regulator transcription factor [Salinarimonas soli]KAA2237558.1 response regulator transcription factor [Salinarimonas soli]
MGRARIAIAYDGAEAAAAHADYLSGLGHEVLVAGSGAGLDRLMEPAAPDLIVLALDLPGERSIDVLRRLRQRGERCPVVILTADPDPFERIVGLELGADDVVAKPVEPQELAARVAGLLRRYGRANREIVAFENATVDLTASRLLRVGQAPERLGPAEVMLVRALAGRPNEVLTRDELIRQAPGESLDAFDRSIDNRIARLRQKLDTQAIVTVRARGYMFVAPQGPGRRPLAKAA